MANIVSVSSNDCSSTANNAAGVHRLSKALHLDALTFVNAFCLTYMCINIYALYELLQAIAKWQLPVDTITYYGVTWNFAAVGVVAVFYQKGIPTYITQGYLVSISNGCSATADSRVL
jgi:Presenilin